MPHAQKYISIWEDFASQKSPEAKFVKQIDCLEMVLQASLYEKTHDCALDEFFDYAKKNIDDKVLQNILDELLQIR